MIHKVALLASLIGASSVAALREPPMGAGNAASAPCMTDTTVANWVLNTVKSVLDAPTSDTSNAEFRAKLGLSGVTYSQVTVVEDSATCERARAAYIRIYYPDVADTTRRRGLTETLDEVLVIRMTSNRYMLATAIYNPRSLYQMYVVDSTYALVQRGF